MISTNFSKELRKKYGKRNFPVKKGDNIRIMKGEFKGKTGKIEGINLKRLRITIDGINRTKKDGTKVNVYFDPSNLQIKELNLEDGKRRQALERKTGKVEEKNGSEKNEPKPVKDTKIETKIKTKETGDKK